MTYCIVGLSFLFFANESQQHNFYIHLYILEQLSLGASREYVHPGLVLGLD
jgi:hypothetical protein